MSGAYQIPPAMIGADLPSYAYPFPVQWFEAQACGSGVRMAHMDVAPTHVANGRFWGETIHALTSIGYWVIAPNQIRFQLYAEKKHTIAEICQLMGISKPTLYNYVAEAGA